MPTIDEVKVVSNDLDDFTSPSIGPEQARIRIKSCEFAAFDYGGTMKGDEVVSVKIMCEPQDGENDGKDFEVHWTTGGKMSEFSIINDGGSLLPTQTKVSLNNNSNWALLLKAMKDCGFNTKLLNGPIGVRYLADGDGAVMTIKNIVQPERAGLEAKSAKGFDRKYYTCLKIEALPGEKRTVRRSAPRGEAQKITKADVGTLNAGTPSQVSNGSGSLDITAIIKAALDANGGSIKIIPDLQKAIFMAAKSSGEPVNKCATIAKSAVDAATLAKLAEEQQWIVDDEGVLVG